MLAQRLTGLDMSKGGGGTGGLDDELDHDLGGIDHDHDNDTGGIGGGIHPASDGVSPSLIPIAS